MTPTSSTSNTRRVRRSSTAPPRDQNHHHSILPTSHHHNTQYTNSLSCWYCDFKMTCFNDYFFWFGQKHRRWLKVWFSVGVGFSFTALVAVTMILVWELVVSSYLYNRNVKNGSSSILYNLFLSPSVLSFRMTIVNCGYMILSTLVSVGIHEFGHAIAAASEGVQVEYIALFLVFIFPGALVALDYDSLGSLPRFATLRIFSAGIWHNAACCAACVLALLLLPSILYPFYVSGLNPMVLDMPAMSPLSGYLSIGDVILSLDGKEVHDPQGWRDMLAHINNQTLQRPYNSSYRKNLQAIHKQKGYCTPNSWAIADEKNLQLEDIQSACPDDLSVFSSIPCFNSSLIDYEYSSNNSLKRNQMFHCFSAKDIFQLRKCGNGWPAADPIGNGCPCSEDESCLMPVVRPGLNWVEIMFARPYSSECLWFLRNSSADYRNPNSQIVNCTGTFIFIGDVLSLTNAVLLTAYRPRWMSMFGAYIPNMLEMFLACTFHVSLTLTLVNSLPVFYLDGESILEVLLCYITWLSPLKKKQFLQICLIVGTVLSVIAFSVVLHTASFN